MVLNPFCVDLSAKTTPPKNVAQSCLTLCDPVDYTIHGILQARRLEWVALLQGISPTQGLNPSLPRYRWTLFQLSHQGSPRILGWAAYPFSRGSAQPRDWTQVSRITGGLFSSLATREAQGYWGEQPILLQGIFLTQESNQGLLHYQQIPYQLSYQGRPDFSPYIPHVCRGQYYPWVQAPAVTFRKHPVWIKGH